MNDIQKARYKRHLLLSEIGEEGQEKLLNSKVLVIGAGGLGSPVILYLAAAGVGTLGIADFDKVDISNLQRQIIHNQSNIDIPKVESAKQKINLLNDDVNVICINQPITQENIATIIADYDLVIDATDNLATKYLINDNCVAQKKPLIHGAIKEFTGNVMTILPGTACFRCVFPDATQPKPSDKSGVFGAIAGITGTIQATEAIKYLTGVGELLTNKILSFNALTMQFNVAEISPSPYCECSAL